MTPNSLETVEQAIRKWEEDCSFDIWVLNVFEDKIMLRCLLNMLVNHKHAIEDDTEQIKKLRKEITFTSKANARKRRALKTMRIKWLNSLS